MKIRTLATSSADGRALNAGIILEFSGKLAGICQDTKNFREILHEPFMDTLERAENTLESNHHGVFGHQCVTLFIEDAPKILTMVLNNEGLFNASENEICHTEIKSSGLEEGLYQKWQVFYAGAIRRRFPEMDDAEVDKWTLIYSQYLISIFTPSTSLAYTTSVKRLNYILGWMEDYIANAEEEETEFARRLAQVFVEFIREFDKSLVISGLRDPNGRSFSLFGTRKRMTEWGENYCFSYRGSFFQLAQAQMHRKIHYEFSFLEREESNSRATFYVPEVIAGTNYEKEWLSDSELLMDNFPQGMMIRINERGTVEDFALKCMKRLNGATSQLDEATIRTASTLTQYYWGTTVKPIRKYLASYIDD